MVIVYMLDGTARICRPASQERLAQQNPELADMTPREFLQWVANKVVPPGATDIEFIRGDTLPAGWEKRGTWTKPDKDQLADWAKKDRDRGPNPDLDRRPQRRR